MTVCKFCKNDLPDLEEYWYFHKGKRRWLKCKSCTLAWRKTEHELSLARERDRKRFRNNPKRREQTYSISNRIRKEKWYGKIHLRTERKIKSLWIRPNECPICWEESTVMAHHINYLEWNKIVFCCKKCHSKIHRWIITEYTIIDLFSL